MKSNLSFSLKDYTTFVYEDSEEISRNIASMRSRAGQLTADLDIETGNEGIGIFLLTLLK